MKIPVKPRMTTALAACLALSLASIGTGADKRADPHEWKMSATDTPLRISEHVWMIKGNPNVAVIVGTRGVLVVDTGMGPGYGEIAAGFAAKLAPGRRLFLTTTHFHPEHAAGEVGFPEDTTLIRNDVQQMEVERYGMDMVKSFAARSDELRESLKGAGFRKPDVTFHDEVKIDLGGGVVARLMWLGKAHTEGDELTFVEPDATLVSGDVVQNATIPMIYTVIGKGGTPTTWLKTVDRITELHAAHVIPDHSEPGDGTLVAAERKLLSEIRSSAIELKRRNVSVEQAGAEISARLKQKHPDWFSTNASAYVNSVYQDPDTTMWE
jgi:glyoxylase-like metal-dependent hydrolase (beta-lactamase superfamily II)